MDLQRNVDFALNCSHLANCYAYRQVAGQLAWEFPLVLETILLRVILVLVVLFGTCRIEGYESL